MYVQRSSNRSRKTKIVCTLGPAANSATTIKQLIKAGMNVARLNLSHGTHSEHIRRIKIISDLKKSMGSPLAILLDLPGPKYRIGQLKEESVLLRKSHQIVLTAKQIEGDQDELTINPASLLRYLEVGDKVFLSDGAIQLRVEETGRTQAKCSVVYGGRLTAGQGAIVPGKAVPGSFISNDLRKHIDFVVKNRPDYLALSFVSGPKDIGGVRKILRQSSVDIPIISKIERGRALDNLDEILAVSDGIMIARGDLGVDIPIQKIALVQKEIIKKCNQAGKPVITATQMLESMVSSPRPTRAEVTDIANAIFDGTDALMLSGETSIGMYPKLAVEMMADVAGETEKELHYKRLLTEKSRWVECQTDALISYDACYTASRLGAVAIVAFTQSGSTAMRVSKYRPEMPILAITPNRVVCGKLELSWGVQVFHLEKVPPLDELFSTASGICKSLGMASPGDLVVITGGVPVGTAGSTNLLKVEKIS